MWVVLIGVFVNQTLLMLCVFASFSQCRRCSVKRCLVSPWRCRFSSFWGTNYRMKEIIWWSPHWCNGLSEAAGFCQCSRNRRLFVLRLTHRRFRGRSSHCVWVHDVSAGRCGDHNVLISAGDSQKTCDSQSPRHSSHFIHIGDASHSRGMCYIFIQISVFSDLKSDECEILLISFILLFHAWIISDSTAHAKFPTFV